MQGIERVRATYGHHLVVVKVIEGGDDCNDAGVSTVHLLYPLEGIGRIVLHEGQVVPRLKPPRLVCAIHVAQNVIAQE